MTQTVPKKGRVADGVPAGGPSTGGSRDADEIVEMIVRCASSDVTHRRVLEIWRSIEADEYLEQCQHVLERAIERNEPFWDMCCALFAFTDLFEPNRYLEIGVRQGRSAVVVAAVNPDVSLYLFDMWHPNYAGAPNPGPDFVRAQLERVGHRGPITFRSGRSRETVPAFFAEAGQPDLFPLITVDGDHRDEGARSDLRNVVSHLAAGGMLLFDDIMHATYPTLGDTWRSFLGERRELIGRENTRDGSGTALAVRRG